MFNFREQNSAASKSVDSLSEELQHFNNQRKLVELDLEKRLLSLEDILKDLKKSLGSLDSVQELKEFIGNLEYVRLKLRDLEDLSLIDKLEGVEVKEKLSDVVVEQDEMKQKLDLVIQALKNLDPNEGDMKKTLGSIKDLQAKVDQVDSLLSDIQSTTLKASDMEPLVTKIDELENGREVLKNDLQRLISTLREQLEIHDKRIVALQGDIAQNVSVAPLREQLAVHEKELEVIRDNNRKLLMLIESKTPRPEAPRPPVELSEGQGKLKEKLVQYEKDIADIRRDVKAVRDALESQPATTQIDTTSFLRKEDARVKQWDATLQRVASLTQQLDDESRKGWSELQQSQLKLFIQNELSRILGQVYAYADKVKDSLETYKVSLSKEIDDIHLKLTAMDPKEKLDILTKKAEMLESTLKLHGEKLNESDSATTKSLIQLKDQSAAITTKVASIERLVQDRLEKLTPEALEQVKETVNLELGDVLENLTQISTSLRDENDGLKSEVNDTVARLQEALTKHIAFNDVSHVEQKVESIESKLKEFQHETTQQYASQVDSLRKRLIDAEGDINKLRVSIPAVSKQEVDELHVKLHDVESKSSMLFENIEKLQATVQRGITDLNRNVYAKVSADTQAVRKEMEYLKEQIDELQNNFLSFEQEASSAPQTPLDQTAIQSIQSIVAMQKKHEESLHALQMKHDKEIAELRLLLLQKSPQQPLVQQNNSDVSNKIEYMQKENEILRKELEKVRDALLHIMQRDTEHPTIIE